MMKWFGLIFLFLLAGVRLGSGQTTLETRPYHMGFTPFPYEITIEAVSFTYRTIAEDADLILHHFDDGVPWTEALAGEPYSQNVQENTALRLANTPDDHTVVVAVNPIRLSRDGLALYRGMQDEMPLPLPFDGYTFDHPDVMTAFLAYCRTMMTLTTPTIS